MAEPQARKREVAVLSEAMAELGVKHGTIVAKNEAEQIVTGRGSIEVVPMWRFLLNLTEPKE
ncbi:MAG: hypothetical protein HY360_14750 [Verrucomicrobia bacterium]|nr:hypothetical protein [Verrucomicrobiota bacterium]